VMGDQVLLGWLQTLDSKLDNLGRQVSDLRESLAVCQAKCKASKVTALAAPSRRRKVLVRSLAATIALGLAAAAEHFLAK